MLICNKVQIKITSYYNSKIVYIWPFYLTLCWGRNNGERNQAHQDRPSKSKWGSILKPIGNRRSTSHVERFQCVHSNNLPLIQGDLPNHIDMLPLNGSPDQGTKSSLGRIHTHHPIHEISSRTTKSYTKHTKLCRVANMTCSWPTCLCTKPFILGVHYIAPLVNQTIGSNTTCWGRNNRGAQSSLPRQTI